jgi:hypothetical protein
MGLGRGARCPSLDEPRSRNYFGHDCAGWLHDIKHDGLRVIARKNGMRVFHATANPALVSKRMTAASNNGPPGQRTTYPSAPQECRALLAGLLLSAALICPDLPKGPANCSQCATRVRGVITGGNQRVCIRSAYLKGERRDGLNFRRSAIAAFVRSPCRYCASRPIFHE